MEFRFSEQTRTDLGFIADHFGSPGEKPNFSRAARIAIHRIAEQIRKRKKNKSP
jgi:hypothetical protein